MKFRSQECEGVVQTNFQRAVFVGTAGVKFDAIVEYEGGVTNVTYLVRDNNLPLLEQAEEGAWLSEEDMLLGEIPEEKRRPNPIRRVAHGFN